LVRAGVKFNCAPGGSGLKPSVAFAGFTRTLLAAVADVGSRQRCCNQPTLALINISHRAL
jgi:hypothetical protein